MKEKLSKQIADYFWLYLLVTAVVVLIWTTVYGNLGKPESDEYVAAGVCNLEFDAEGFRADVLNAFPERTEQKISVVYADTLSIDFSSSQATTRLAVQQQSTDFFIIPESSLERFNVADYFPQWPELLQYDGTAYYAVDGIPYGIQVAGPGVSTVFSRYCDADEPCYLLLSEASVNLDRLFDRGEAGDDAALAAIRYILECDLP